MNLSNNKPALNSHTQLVTTFRDCQVAPANATNQTYQRVCLSNRTTKTEEKEQRSDKTGLAKVAVQCSADSFVVKIVTFAKPQNVIIIL